MMKKINFFRLLVIYRNTYLQFFNFERHGYLFMVK